MPEGREVGGIGEKVEGIEKCNLVVQNSHGDVRYSIGNIANNIVITVYDASGVLDIWEDHFVKYMIV